ncbi:MAG: diversity-generating retroelement protein Avd [Candidatus Delongbacteria bacterium]|nr:diversity-generating retroelement protein Avd [Candidatus Delongbacteria bacterium]
MEKMNNEITILPKLYDLMLWYSDKFAKYPKKYKYNLGDRIFTLMLDILENIIEAKYGRSKKQFLKNVNLSLEKLRFLIRLSKDTQCLTIKAYEYASKEIDEIGKMTGGWLKVGD